MGKIRVKTIGDEEIEKKDLKKAQARAEAKKAKEAAEARKAAAEGESQTKAEAEPKAEEVKTEKAEPEKKQVKAATKPSTDKEKKLSASYQKAASFVEKNRKYKLVDALPLLEKMKRAKFDETVELHINTNEKGISGNFTLPHGTGKQMRVVIANAAVDAKQVDELIKSIEAGKIDFDILVATPETMSKLARVARVLGPRGLMPNPKNGTVTPKPEDVAKRFAGGQINFKTEAKFPVLHLAVGKISFGDKKLTENIATAIQAVKTKNIRNVTLKSTMSPAIKLDSASL
ncbi:MAG: 50S ribosomal protein L1 [Candidatus Levyibacteriota bacterium]